MLRLAFRNLVQNKVRLLVSVAVIRDEECLDVSFHCQHRAGDGPFRADVSRRRKHRRATIPKVPPRA